MERHARDEFVSELTSYYTFLTHVFLPPSAIRHPPPGGWAHITPSFVDSYGLGKDAAVTDLMRHIPYILRDEADGDHPWIIYEKTAAVDYAGEVILGRRNKRGVEHLVEPEVEEMFCGMPPAHVYVLATHTGGRDGHFVFVDTRRAVVVVADWQVGPRSTELSLSVSLILKTVRNRNNSCLNSSDDRTTRTSFTGTSTPPTPLAISSRCSRTTSGTSRL